MHLHHLIDASLNADADTQDWLPLWLCSMVVNCAMDICQERESGLRSFMTGVTKHLERMNSTVLRYRVTDSMCSHTYLACICATLVGCVYALSVWLELAFWCLVEMSSMKTVTPRSAGTFSVR